MKAMARRVPPKLGEVAGAGEAEAAEIWGDCILGSLGSVCRFVSVSSYFWQSVKEGEGDESGE